jgi:SAM-dependent methyltransferase
MSRPVSLSRAVTLRLVPRIGCSTAMDYYRRHARELAEQYDSLSPDVVHSAWKHLLPDEPGMAVDVGAGSGRDANWLAGLGWNVVAVEPEAAFRQRAQARCPPRVTWLDDRLPGLQRLRGADAHFDLVLVSAVWMHLPPDQREAAFRVLRELVAPGGMLVVSVRYEPDAKLREIRGFHEAPPDELETLAKQHALALMLRHRSVDALGRKAVSWETLVFRLPDESLGRSGAPPV